MLLAGLFLAGKLLLDSSECSHHKTIELHSGLLDLFQDSHHHWTDFSSNFDRTCSYSFQFNAKKSQEMSPSVQALRDELRAQGTGFPFQPSKCLYRNVSDQYPSNNCWIEQQ
ncbi:hypothetical protein ACMYSQ_009282 [Aspergillus niger]